MTLTKCNNGHFFDWDLFKTCPHCEEDAKKKTQDLLKYQPLGGIGRMADDIFLSEDPLNIKNNQKVCAFCGKKYKAIILKQTAYLKKTNCDTCGALLVETTLDVKKLPPVKIGVKIDRRIKKILFSDIDTDVLSMLDNLTRHYKTNSLYYKVENNILTFGVENYPKQGFKPFTKNDISKCVYQRVSFEHEYTHEEYLKSKNNTIIMSCEDMFFEDCTSEDCVKIIDWIFNTNPTDLKIIQEY